MSSTKKFYEPVEFNSTVDATDNSTGAVKIDGGLVIGKNMIIDGGMTIGSHVIPSTNIAYDLGSSTNR